MKLFTIVPRDTRYIPLVQQKSCCLPACILMIMYRQGLPLVPQELLGYHLGLIVDKKNKHLFWNARTAARPPAAGWGSRTYESKYHPNKAFSKLKIPLRAVYHSIDALDKEEYVKFMSSAIKQDKDIIACFNHGVLSDTKKRNGHLCVVDRVYPKKGMVRLIDPSPKQPKWRLVPINKLYQAMKAHPVDGGFWELIGIKKRAS